MTMTSLRSIRVPFAAVLVCGGLSVFELTHAVTAQAPSYRAGRSLTMQVLLDRAGFSPGEMHLARFTPAAHSPSERRVGMFASNQPPEQGQIYVEAIAGRRSMSARKTCFAAFRSDRENAPKPSLSHGRNHRSVLDYCVDRRRSKRQRLPLQASR
jgi:hypothetical protein